MLYVRKRANEDHPALRPAVGQWAHVVAMLISVGSAIPAGQAVALAAHADAPGAMTGAPAGNREVFASLSGEQAAIVRKAAEDLWEAARSKPEAERVEAAKAAMTALGPLLCDPAQTDVSAWRLAALIAIATGDDQLAAMAHVAIARLAPDYRTHTALSGLMDALEARPIADRVAPVRRQFQTTADLFAKARGADPASWLLAGQAVYLGEGVPANPAFAGQIWQRAAAADPSKARAVGDFLFDLARARAQQPKFKTNDPYSTSGVQWAIATTLARIGDDDGARAVVSGFSEPRYRSHAARELAKLQEGAGRVDAAVQTLKPLVQAADEDTVMPARRELVMLLIRTGRLDEAKQVADVGLEHTDFYLKAQLSTALAAAGRHEEADAVAAAIPPEQRDLYGIGNTLARQRMAGEPPESIEHVIREVYGSSRRMTAEQDAARRQGIAEAEGGNLSAAAQTMDSITDPALRTDVLAAIVARRARDGDLAGAIGTAKSAGSGDAQRQSLHLAALALARVKGHDAAWQLAQAIEPEGWRSRTVHRLALARGKDGQSEAGLNLIATIKDPASRADALRAFAEVLSTTGQAEAAQRTLAEARSTMLWVTEKEESSAARRRLALALAKAGRRPEAAAMAQTIGAADTRLETLEEMALDFVRAGDRAGAMDMAQLLAAGLDRWSSDFESTRKAQSKVVAIAVGLAEAGDFDSAYRAVALCKLDGGDAFKTETLLAIARARAGTGQLGDWMAAERVGPRGEGVVLVALAEGLMVRAAADAR